MCKCVYTYTQENSVGKPDLMSVVLLQIYIFYNESYTYKTYTCFSVLSTFIEVFSLKALLALEWEKKSQEIQGCTEERRRIG